MEKRHMLVASVCNSDRLPSISSNRRQFYFIVTLYFYFIQIFVCEIRQKNIHLNSKAQLLIDKYAIVLYWNWMNVR